MNEQKLKTVELDFIYKQLKSCYGSDELSGHEAHEAGRIARLFEQDYKIVGGVFKLLNSSCLLNIHSLRLIIVYGLKLPTKNVDDKFVIECSPVSIGLMICDILDKLLWDHTTVFIDEDTVTIKF